MPADVRVVPTEDRYLESFRATLDAVAKERRYLLTLQAPPLSALQKIVSDTVAGGGVQLFAVDAPERVVGWCGIGRHQREGCRHVGNLGMGLLPDYRGQGIGARLALEAIAAARKNGIERIELEVLASNTNAIALYRKLGFVEEGVRRRARLLDGRYDDAMMMALLDAPAPR
jgi:RimJ/RimL family protein N-acetyltransferase